MIRDGLSKAATSVLEWEDSKRLGASCMARMVRIVGINSKLSA